MAGGSAIMSKRAAPAIGVDFLIRLPVFFSRPFRSFFVYMVRAVGLYRIDHREKGDGHG